ncbi:hypothetical protein LWX53_02355 [bacterium]|nr:hypothetical protein [bacterium]
MRKTGRTGEARAASAKSGNVVFAHNVMKSGNVLRAAIALAAVALALAGCDLAPQGSKGSTASLFAVDSKNGNVYEIDETAAAAAGAPLLSVAQNAAGEIVFSEDIGFVAVGSYNNTAPGLYRFDVSAAAPQAVRVGNRISAQYACVVSGALGYVTSADYGGGYANAVYSFNPASAAAGLGAAVAGAPAGFFPQDIAVAGGRVFVADNGNNKVLRLSADGASFDAAYPATARGTTGLLAGGYDYDKDGDDDVGVFVANTGGYDANWNALPGSIDFIPADASDGAAATPVLAGVGVGRLAAFGDKTLVATNYGATYIVSLSGVPAATEVKCAGLSFGSFDAAVRGGYAYVPDGANGLYRFSAAGTDARKIAVGKSGEYVTNVGVRP